MLASFIGAELIQVYRVGNEITDLLGTELDGALHVVSPLEKLGKHAGELIYWERSHYHPTPFGCELVGEVLADFIRDHDLLKRQDNQ